MTVPGTIWGWSLGAKPRQAGAALELEGVERGGFADKAGLRAGDLLLTLAGIRVHDVQQLWTVQALTGERARVEVTWLRGGEAMSGEVAP